MRKRVKKRRLIDSDEEDPLFVGADDVPWKKQLVVSEAESGAAAASWSSSDAEEQEMNTMREGELWTEKYSPHTSSELCVHAKKRNEIERWLMQNSAGNSPSQHILVLSGPAGCCKSTTLRVLCQQHKIELISWKEEADFSAHRFNSSRLSYRSELHIPYESKLSKFRHFLTRAQKYGGLSLSQACSPRRLILVEELPYIERPDLRNEFRDIVRTISLRCAVAFVFTSEHEGRSASFRSFGADLLSSPRIHEISMNPISRSALRKVLTRISTIESINISQPALESYIELAHGDLRSAILNLQFHNLKRCRGHSPGPTASVSRDHMLSIHHSLGKILYGKEVLDPDMVVSSSTLAEGTFCEHLHENAIRFLDDSEESLESHAAVAVAFSESDVLSSHALTRFSEFPATYASSLCCRAYMCARIDCGKGSKGSWRPMYAPEGRSMRENRTELRDTVQQCLFNDAGAATFSSALLGLNSRHMYTCTLAYISMMWKLGRRWPTLGSEKFANLLWRLGQYSQPGRFNDRAQTHSRTSILEQQQQQQAHPQPSQAVAICAERALDRQNDQEIVLMHDELEQF